MHRYRLVGIAALMILGCQTAPHFKSAAALAEMSAADIRAQAADEAPRPPAPPPLIAPSPADKKGDKDKTTIQPPPDPMHDPNVKPAGAGGEIKFTGRVIARVNGTPILEEDAVAAALNELYRVRASRLPSSEKAGLERQIVHQQTEQIIDRELLLQDAIRLVPERSMNKIQEIARKEFDSKVKLEKEQLKVNSDEEYEEMLERFGISLEHRRRQFERNFIASEYLRNRVRAKVENIAFDRQQLEEYYHAHPEEFNPAESVQWLHLFINRNGYPSEEEARRKADLALAEAKKCKNKAEFIALIERGGDGPSAKRNGEGQGNIRGAIEPRALEDTLFGMKPGDMSPLLSTPEGYHIVVLVKHDAGGKVPFEQACPTIRSKLQNEAGAAEFQRFLKELRGKAYIEMAGR